jgi:DNA-binding response OmpR family regulator
MTKEFKDFSLLYIEDDDGVRTINLRILTRLFKNVYEAIDGEMGWELYNKHKPQIILTDIKMPKFDGISLAKKIREHDKTTKIIITTAFSDSKYLLEAVELNLERYLVKPLTKRNLLPALQKAVDGLKENAILSFSENFYFNYDTELFYFDDKVIDMTKKELTFLKLLVKNKDRIVSYSQIESEVWGDEYMSMNSLRTSLGFLRKKLPKNIIKNVSNMGYTLKIDG